MITSLSQSVQDKLALRATLEGRQRQEEDVQATRSELEKVLLKSRRFGERYSLVRDRLLTAQQTEVEKHVTEAANRVRRSQESFPGAPRQVSILRTALTELEEAEKKLRFAWKSYIDQQINPSMELLKLVESLPEIQRQSQRIAALKAQLGQVATELPVHQEHLTRFDRELEELQGMLTSLGALSPAVERFLHKVLNETATLADLTEEVWAWCQQEGRASAFQIRFAKSGPAR